MKMTNKQKITVKFIINNYVKENKKTHAARRGEANDADNYIFRISRKYYKRNFS